MTVSILSNLSYHIGKSSILRGRQLAGPATGTSGTIGRVRFPDPSFNHELTEQFRVCPRAQSTEPPQLRTRYLDPYERQFLAHDVARPDCPGVASLPILVQLVRRVGR
jgi:hypothetical protein